MIKKSFTLSGYTTTYNCLQMEYPFEVCIRSILGFCDEVVVVDAGSTDGTLEQLTKLSREDSRVKLVVEPVDFNHPRWAIHQDGYLKGKARARCTGEYCWQTDTDEVVPPEDYAKIVGLPQILGDYPVMMLPMVEFWGSFEVIRGDFFTWKPRFSRNDERIIHGIPSKHKLIDSQGHEYPRPFFSDSCNYIHRQTHVDIPAMVPLSLTGDEYAKMTVGEKEKFLFRCLDLFPSVYHISWLSLPRKIRHYKRFWQAFHASMYNLSIADTAENNVMFDKPWAEVTEGDIAVKADELKVIGPRSFHSKIKPDVIGTTFPFSRPIPQPLLDWTKAHSGAPTITVKEFPLVSAIVPSYGKAEYLAESVQSVLDQDYANIEVVIVNDGSPDNTNEVAKQLIRENPKRLISVVEKKNGGISDARNFGIARAQGNYIVTLDGDDVARPTFVRRAMEQVFAAGAQLVSCDVEIFGHAPGKWAPNNYTPLAIRYDNTIPSLVLFERALWEQSGGYNVAFPFVEDWDFFVSCSRLFPKVVQIREPLFLYRSSTTGLAHIFTDRYPECLSMVISSQEDLYSVDEALVAHSKIMRFPATFFDRFARQQQLHPDSWLLHFWQGLRAEGNGDAGEALRCYTEALRLSEGKNWQPYFRVGLIELALDPASITNSAFLQSRLLRPDTRSQVLALTRPNLIHSQTKHAADFGSDGPGR